MWCYILSSLPGFFPPIGNLMPLIASWATLLRLPTSFHPPLTLFTLLSPSSPSSHTPLTLLSPSSHPLHPPLTLLSPSSPSSHTPLTLLSPSSPSSHPPLTLFTLFTLLSPSSPAFFPGRADCTLKEREQFLLRSGARIWDLFRSTVQHFSHLATKRTWFPVIS